MPAIERDVAFSERCDSSDSPVPDGDHQANVFRQMLGGP